MIVSTLCSEIQELLSASYDGTTFEPDAVKAAQAHCAACPECASFLRFLADVRALPAPVAPEHVIVRTLDAVRSLVAEEEEARQAAAAASALAEAAPPASATDAPTPVATPAAKPRFGIEIGGWRPTAPWYAAAAVMLVGAVFVAAQGVDFIMSGDGRSTVALDASAPETMLTEDYAIRSQPADPESDKGWSDEKSLGAELSAPAGASVAQSGSLVAYGGYAYRSSGDSAQPDGTATGVVTSSLDGAGAPTQWPAWLDGTGRFVVIDAEERGFLRFERVERTLEGSRFALFAERLDSFDAQPGLPSAIPPPAAPDGSPTFVTAGTDDLGAQVFVRPGSDPAAGFALAPGVAASGWTWWVPAP